MLVKVNCIIITLIIPADYIHRKPKDIWTTKEKLALASSVQKSGDQNWFVFIMNTLKYFAIIAANLIFL